MGVAVYPKDAADAGALQRFADMALYRVKSPDQRKNGAGPRWSAFDENLRAESDRRSSCVASGCRSGWYERTRRR